MRASLARAASARDYRRAHDRLTTRLTGLGPGIRGSVTPSTMTAGVITTAFFAVGGGISLANLLVAGVGSTVMAMAKTWTFAPMWGMRRVIRRSPDRSDRLVFELDRAEAAVAWVKESHSQRRWLGASGRRRATRALHRALQRCVDALGDPDLAATAHLLLPRAIRMLESMTKDGVVAWPAHGRFLNQMHERYLRTREPEIADLLYRCVVVAQHQLAADLEAEFARPRDVPMRTVIAFGYAKEANYQRARNARKAGDEELWTQIMSVGDIEIWRRLPRWLRGEGYHRRGQLRRARRIVALAEAECRLLDHAKVSPSVIAERHVGTITPSLAAAERIAEINGLRYGLGDTAVRPTTLHDDARRVAFLAATQAGDVQPVIARNEARMQLFGITTLTPQRRATTPDRTGDTPGRVPAERIEELLDHARASKGRESPIDPLGL